MAQQACGERLTLFKGTKCEVELLVISAEQTGGTLRKSETSQRPRHATDPPGHSGLWSFPPWQHAFHAQHGVAARRHKGTLFLFKGHKQSCA